MGSHAAHGRENKRVQLPGRKTWREESFAETSVLEDIIKIYVKISYECADRI
jgi:hypothetical protein